MTDWPLFAIRYQYGGHEFSVYLRARNFPDAEARLACLRNATKLERVTFAAEAEKLGRKPDGS
jgi:hypothetical protein